MYVPAETTLYSGLLLGHSHGDIHEMVAPWHPPRVVCFASCKAALWGALRALRLAHGDRILAPAYLFYSVLHPAQALGLSVDLYRVDSSLNPDLQDVAARIDERTRAVLLVHYFGFPGPATAMRRLCDEHGVALIEDCAHALFSRDGSRALGSFGDASIFSLKKVLPVPGGGVLALNSPALRFDDQLKGSDPGETLYLLARRVLNSLEAASGWSIKARLLSSHGFRRRLARGKDGPANHYGNELSRLSAHMARRTDPSAIVRRRRANYQFLLTELADLTWLRPVFDCLPAGVSPFCFPVFVPDRDHIQDCLLRQGIHARVYWDVTELPNGALENHPEVAFILDSILALPVHQGVTTRQIRAVAEVLRSLRGSQATA